ncbi:hypothetical protein NPX13_g7253 [Xylaria arbuscula]|uniref:Uncharacterized protein n=1 Tax=Xylaria arbuscula TaxID=114810 RepID=A0A9W8NAC5_9PEZI|nr:hypothetical protein NPX13_g7253 [Xylaria arbuscula]
MLLLPVFSGVTVALLAHGASSASVPRKRQIPTDECEAHLLIDDFATWQNGTNSVLGATSDDATMNSTSLSAGVLSFVPNNQDVSYIYEQWECIDTEELGYDSISFTIKGPAAASVSLELQTKDDCDATEYQSYYYTLNGLTGSLQTVSIPLSNWPNASIWGTVGFVWYGFSAGLTGTDNQWQLSNFTLLCAETRDNDEDEDDGDVRTPKVHTPAKRAISSTDSWVEEKKREAKQALAFREAAVIADAKQQAGRSQVARADAACEISLIDDWASQSRLTFLRW